MVSHAVCTSAEGAENYYASHLRSGDYFAADEPGRWHGRLTAEVAGQPITAESFRQRFLALAGRQRRSDILYQEFTYTAPKGFSVAAAVDPRLKGELLAAVREEFDWLETFARVRDRRGALAATETTRPTGMFRAALFAHETSRTNDPNFHVHGLVANLTRDPERGKDFALHYGEMMRMRKTLDARLHNNLARRCAALGYTVEAAPSGFGLREVSREAAELFSSRARQVATAKELLRLGYSVPQLRAAADRAGNARGSAYLDPARLQAALADIAPKNRPNRPKHALDAEAVLLTRPAKEPITGATLREDVAARLAAAGLAVRVPPSPSPSPAAPPDQPPPRSLGAPAEKDHAALLNRVFAQTAAKVFATESVVRLDVFVAEAARLAPGELTNDEMAAAVRASDRLFIARESADGAGAGTPGHEMVTTHAILAEERALLAAVGAGLRGAAHPPLCPAERYAAPPFLLGTPENLDGLLRDAAARGEELTRGQAETWLRQFRGIYQYVATSADQFLNVRGGAGVGKTFALERLVGESLAAGRAVFLAAPYGEQARGVLRAEAARLAGAGQEAVAGVFAAANTVDHLLARARGEEFAPRLRGADIYVDEAGLLDTSQALALARLAREHGARVIFQGDTAQLAAVGRGQPIRLLQDRLGLGLGVERASVSRRQRRLADKRLAVELSSGDALRFGAALEALIGRGHVREVDGDALVHAAARRIAAARAARRDPLAVSSVHRLGEAVSDRLHALRLEADPQLACARIATRRSKGLAPAERLSSQFYQPGDVVEYARVPGAALLQGRVEGVAGGALRVRAGGRLQTVELNQVADVFTQGLIERAAGAKFLLLGKVKEGRRVHENKSLQVLAAIEGEHLVFASGLRLRADDGRLAQGDVVTAYKAQGAKADSVLVVEDNRSLAAMASREALHVLFTRHVDSVEMLVESHDVLRAAADRSQQKHSALEFAAPRRPASSGRRQRAADRPAPNPSRPRRGAAAAAWGQLWDRFKARASFQLRLAGRKTGLADLLRPGGVAASIAQLGEALGFRKTAPPPPWLDPGPARPLERRR